MPMRSSVALSALAAFVLTPVADGYAPALGQDFSITNQVEPNSRRDLMRQLQAWWDAHAYYPRHASNNDEGGTVKVHLVIRPDGRLWTVNVVESSGSRSLDAAGSSVFRDVFVRPFPEGEPNADVDISLHYVLAHRHDQPVAAGYTPVSSKSPFTIMNDPVRSPVVDTMLQRNCAGTAVLGGIRNHPEYGLPYAARAIFFRKADGTPWVKFDKGGHRSISPVIEVGKMVQWTGAEERPCGYCAWYFPQYTAWLDGDNHLSGAIGSRMVDNSGVPYNQNGGTVDLTCTTEVLPAVTWNAWWITDTRVTPPGDPP
jgi:TonB family protein